MFTFFYVLDLAQVSNTRIIAQLRKKPTVVSFLTSIFVNSVATGYP